MLSSCLSLLFYFYSILLLIWTEIFSRMYFCLFLPNDCQLAESRTTGKWKHPATTDLLPVAAELTFPRILLDLHLQSSVTHQNISKLYVNSLDAWLANEAYSKGASSLLYNFVIFKIRLSTFEPSFWISIEKESFWMLAVHGWNGNYLLDYELFLTWMKMQINPIHFTIWIEEIGPKF